MKISKVMKLHKMRIKAVMSGAPKKIIDRLSKRIIEEMRKKK